jgi:uncharacterized membrane protein YoaK (UPF0700 family)
VLSGDSPLNTNIPGVLICIACGVLDAACFVALGGTFVGLMTGNLILMGVSLGGASGGVPPALFLYPLGGYAVGALLAGTLFKSYGIERASRMGLWMAAFILFAIMVFVWVGAVKANTAQGWLVVVVTALYMGFQSAVLYLSKRVTITTNVMTSTLTSFLADYPLQVFGKGVSWHKFFALMGFLFGVVLGALLVSVHIGYAFSVSFVFAVLAIAALLRSPVSASTTVSH